MKKSLKSGFTLLEVMMAVAVLALVGISIYRFVETTLAAVRFSTEQFRDNALTGAFSEYLRAQLQSLPASRKGVLTGEPHRFNDIPADELRWISGSGSGVLTRFAPGEWNVTLTTRALKNGDAEMGLRRQDVDGHGEATWLPLFAGVKGFEVRYFDGRTQEWVEKWTDLTILPALVRVRLWRGASAEAYEVVLPLPAAAQVPKGMRRIIRRPEMNPALPGSIPQGKTGTAQKPQGGNP